jgi:hypothetical protein
MYLLYWILGVVMVFATGSLVIITFGMCNQVDTQAASPAEWIGGSCAAVVIGLVALSCGYGAYWCFIQ